MSFVTEDVIKKILRSSDPSRVVTEFKWDVQKEDSTKGFSSDSYHIRVVCKMLNDDRVHEKYFFVKDPYNSVLYPKLKNLGVYEKELYMYETVLPALHRVLGEECLAPKFYYSDNKQALVLEDLSRDNYHVFDRHKQLDFEHCVKSLKHLAKFHAASVRLNEVSPEVLDSAKRSHVYHKYFQVPEGREYFTNQLKAVLTSIYADEVKSREEDFRTYEDRFVHKLVHIVNDTENTFKVLAHADTWTNNIMFKYDKYQDIENIKLIDFQHSHWTTPIIDLYHFFVICVRFATFQKYSDVFLEIYVNTLNRVLASLGSGTSLSLDELHQSFDGTRDYGIFIVSYSLSLAMADDKAVESGNVDVSEHVQSEFYRTLASKWLSYFDGKGVFSQSRLAEKIRHTRDRT